MTPEVLTAAQLDALLAVQDPRFFAHRGWDVAGGTMTTITLALVKRLYFVTFRAGLPKIRQSLIARFALDRLVSKRDQLTLFINTVWLGTVDGKDVMSLAAGARAFYGKRFHDLSEDEDPSLLVCDRPGALNPHADPRGNARRVLQIKRLLAGQSRRPGLLGRTPNCGNEGPA